MKTPTIALILRSLATAVSMPDLFGGKAARVAPVLDTLAALAEVPEALEPQRQALLDMVQSWVDQTREPTDEELAQFRTVRDDLHAQIQQARANLEGGTK